MFWLWCILEHPKLANLEPHRVSNPWKCMDRHPNLLISPFTYSGAFQGPLIARRYSVPPSCRLFWDFGALKKSEQSILGLVNCQVLTLLPASVFCKSKNMDSNIYNLSWTFLWSNKSNHSVIHGFLFGTEIGGSQLKHRKNCECCPVSQLIVMNSGSQLSEL